MNLIMRIGKKRKQSRDLGYFEYSGTRMLTRFLFFSLPRRMTWRLLALHLTYNFYSTFLPTVKQRKLCLSLVPCVFRGFKIQFCHSSLKLSCYYGNLLRHKDVYILFSNEWRLWINAISVIASLSGTIIPPIKIKVEVHVEKRCKLLPFCLI